MTDDMLIEKVARVIRESAIRRTGHTKVIDPEATLTHSDVARAEDVLAFLREQGLLPEWRPIETAPNDETILLVYDDGSMRSIDAYNNYYVWKPYRGWRGPGVISPTHWMPLPALPAGEAK